MSNGTTGTGVGAGVVIVGTLTEGASAVGTSGGGAVVEPGDTSIGRTVGRGRASRFFIGREGTGGAVGETGAGGGGAGFGAGLATNLRICSCTSGSTVLSWFFISSPCCWHSARRSLLSMFNSRANANIRTFSFCCCKRNSPRNSQLVIRLSPGTQTWRKRIRYDTLRIFYPPDGSGKEILFPRSGSIPPS